jgi:glycosyltransferase involved in cell wall biosynthesis
MVDAAREQGVEVEVVSPAALRHFGIAYGHGVLGNLRGAPWKALLVPAFLVDFALAARRGARGADVVHAHWLPSGLVGLVTGKPLIVQPWGTDIELARRVPWAGRFVLRRARLVVAASSYLAESARELGARDVRVIPVPIHVPARVAEPDEPPHVLFVGRLSEEKGILDFIEATEGLPRVIVGDGPLRDRVPEAVGWVSPERIGDYYEQAAVVCVPSRREGYGMVAREAMAYGRPVVATAVGGLVDAVVPGETGVLVPPRDAGELHAAIGRLLAEPALRRELGNQARRRTAETLAAGGEELRDAYASAA